MNLRSVQGAIVTNIAAAAGALSWLAMDLCVPTAFLPLSSSFRRTFSTFLTFQLTLSPSLQHLHPQVLCCFPLLWYPCR